MAKRKLVLYILDISSKLCLGSKRFISTKKKYKISYQLTLNEREKVDKTVISIPGWSTGKKIYGTQCPYFFIGKKTHYV